MSGGLIGKTLTPTDSPNYAGAAGYAILPLVIVAVGGTIHAAVDRRRHPDHAGTRRTAELFLVWLLVTNGVFSVVAGVMHTSGLSDEFAIQIGYPHSIFQWEIGWADIGIGALLLACAVRRDGWMTAAVVMWVISYWGDAIGHIIQWTEHSNTTPGNLWAIPSDILFPLLAGALLMAHRRLR